MIPQDVLNRLLDEDLEQELAERLSSSPPQAPPLATSLTPLRKGHRAPAAPDAIALKASAVVLRKLSAMDSPPSAARDDSSRSGSPSTSRDLV